VARLHVALAERNAQRMRRRLDLIADFERSTDQKDTAAPTVRYAVGGALSAVRQLSIAKLRRLEAGASAVVVGGGGRLRVSNW